MESDPSIEFDFFLAEKLSTTVADLHEHMSAAEHTGWQVYYGRKAQREQLAMRKR